MSSDRLILQRAKALLARRARASMMPLDSYGGAMRKKRKRRAGVLLGRQTGAAAMGGRRKRVVRRRRGGVGVGGVLLGRQTGAAAMGGRRRVKRRRAGVLLGRQTGAAAMGGARPKNPANLKRGVYVDKNGKKHGYYSYGQHGIKVPYKIGDKKSRNHARAVALGDVSKKIAISRVVSKI
jgi:hypothetical protein